MGELLPDLIGEVNLTLSLLFRKRDLSSIGEKLPSYVASAVRSTTSEGLSRQSLIRVPYQARVRAREQGTHEQVRVFERVLSLDALMEREEGSHEGEEPLAFPLRSSERAKERHPERRAQVEEYLSYLPARAAAILRLRYGLCDENERCHSASEVAHLLGTTRGVVRATERQAIKRLRALFEGRATLILHRGKPTISSPEIRTHRRVSPEEETLLREGYITLQAQGQAVTIGTLARETGVSQEKAATFLRTRRGEGQHQQNRGYGKRKRTTVESHLPLLYLKEMFSKNGEGGLG